jgi:hypothetical protein
MSRGPGRVQRAILAVIATDSDSAWTITQLCQHIYSTKSVEEKHRVSVIRALRTMHLPDSWALLYKSGPEFYFVNMSSVESVLRHRYLLHPWPSDFNQWKRKHPYQLAIVRKQIGYKDYL